MSIGQAGSTGTGGSSEHAVSSMHGGRIAIVGAAETDEIGKVPNMSVLELHAQAARNALRDAGLTLADVDGLATTIPLTIEVAHHLGVTPRWVDGTVIGGGSYMLHVRHAAAAIAAGAADVVLITHGESGRSRNGSPAYGMNGQSLGGQFEAPYGALMPYQLFTLPAMRFLHDRGLGEEALAEVVVAQREWAVKNPRAARRDPVTVDEVLGGSMIAYPFRKDMCCVVTDGGGALVVTSAERAADLPSAGRAVYLLGSGEATESTLISQMDDLSSFGAFRRASAAAFESAGLTPADIDHLMGYDAFAHLPLYILEDLGFAAKGEAAALIAEGHTRPGGRLPMNTSGGGLSYTHTGMYGMFAILEAVRQLRGEAAVQVPGIRTSFVQGVGLFFAAAASLVLTNQKP
jgi:acetyl-CoA acetyltransferase